MSAMFSLASEGWRLPSLGMSKAPWTNASQTSTIWCNSPRGGSMLCTLSQTFNSMFCLRLCVLLVPIAQSCEGCKPRFYTHTQHLSPWKVHVIALKLHNSSLVDIYQGALLAVDTISVGETRPATQSPCLARHIVGKRFVGPIHQTWPDEGVEGKTPPTSWPAQAPLYFVCLKNL